VFAAKIDKDVDSSIQTSDRLRFARAIG